MASCPSMTVKHRETGETGIGRKDMFGFQEVLIVAVAVVALLFVPRMLSTGNTKRPAARTVHLSGVMRVAIVVSVVYPVLAAAWLQPWQDDPIPFVYIGCGPVVLAWLLFWAATGFRRR